MYQAIYRKYRPKRFLDVIGQEHITTTLKNEIKLERIAHSYLFTGTRGTGKTTCARIFAKAVNCENPGDGEPCGVCDICRGIDAESILDIIEVDAASNRGVDNIRDIREEARYAPSMAAYKVYIIDEVHMLSTEAFNALLKTLEEPPAHVIFILATTEAHLIAPTILSRCQRFDFRRVETQLIKDLICDICTTESILFDEDAAFEIARLGDGSVRDALSVLERCVFSGEKLTRALVLDVVGLSPDEYLEKFAIYIKEHDLSGALSLLDELYLAGKDIALLCERMIWLFRSILVAKSGREGAELINMREGNAGSILKLAHVFSMTEALDATDVFIQTLDRLPRTQSKRVLFEMCLIRLCKGDTDSQSPAKEAAQSAEAVPLKDKSPQIMEAKKDLEPEEYKAADIAAKPDQDNTQGQSKIKGAEESPAPPPKKPPEVEASEPGGKFSRYQKLISLIRESGSVPLAAQLKSAEAYLYDDKLVIMCPHSFLRTVIESSKKEIEEAAQRLMSRRIKVETKIGDIEKKSPKPPRDDDPDPLDSLIEIDGENNVSFDDYELPGEAEFSEPMETLDDIDDED